jgi:nucleoside-diphosphate-sugar epimerase
LRAAPSRGQSNLLWSRSHVDDVASAVLAALATRAADGQALNLGERATPTMSAWVQQIITAAQADLQLVRVPDQLLPPELALLAAPAQHLLAATERAQQLLNWQPADPHTRVHESVQWHLTHPTHTPWTDQDTALDDAALRSTHNLDPDHERT